MQNEFRIPSNFRECDSSRIIFSNLEDKIDFEIADEIKTNPLFSRYAAWDYNGKVWFDDKLGFWCIEIWKYGIYETTHMNQSLEELINEVQNFHGDK